MTPLKVSMSKHRNTINSCESHDEQQCFFTLARKYFTRDSHLKIIYFKVGIIIGGKSEVLNRVRNEKERPDVITFA
jgi:hypothetical protein